MPSKICGSLTPKLALLAYKREAPPPSRRRTQPHFARTHTFPSTQELEAICKHELFHPRRCSVSIFVAGDFVKLSARDIDTTGHLVKHFLTVDLAVN